MKRPRRAENRGARDRVKTLRKLKIYEDSAKEARNPGRKNEDTKISWFPGFLRGSLPYYGDISVWMSEGVGEGQRLRLALCLGLLCLCLCPAITEAAESFAGDFLTLGVGARPLGMGGAFAAVADDSTATYWNPAGLGLLRHSEAAFMHSSLGELDSYDFVNYVHPIGQKASIGLSWLRVGVDDIPITGVQFPSQPVGPRNRPRITGTFSNTDNAFLLSYGRQVGPASLNLFAGGSAKFIYISALRNTNAFGLGGDLGLLWRTNPEKSSRFSAAVVVQDFFKTRLYWNTPPESADQGSNSDTIQPNVRVGFSLGQDIKALNSRMLLTLDTDSLYDFELHYGGEYVFADLLSLRLGIQERKGLNTRRLFTAGAGLRLAFLTGAAFSVDYAFLSNDELGNSNRISLMTRF